jgi:hypothetical protein
LIKVLFGLIVLDDSRDTLRLVQGSHDADVKDLLLRVELPKTYSQLLKVKTTKDTLCLELHLESLQNVFEPDHYLCQPHELRVLRPPH